MGQILMGSSVFRFQCKYRMQLCNSDTFISLLFLSARHPIYYLSIGNSMLYVFLKMASYPPRMLPVPYSFAFRNHVNKDCRNFEQRSVGTSWLCWVAADWALWAVSVSSASQELETSDTSIALKGDVIKRIPEMKT